MQSWHVLPRILWSKQFIFSCRKRIRLSPPNSTASGEYASPQEPSYSGGQEEENPAGNVGFGGALINVLNILSGIGLLSVPYALKKAGWIGLGVLWLLGIVTNYTGISSVQILYITNQWTNMKHSSFRKCCICSEL